jgi:hypothetical protein
MHEMSVRRMSARAGVDVIKRSSATRMSLILEKFRIEFRRIIVSLAVIISALILFPPHLEPALGWQPP